MLRARSARREDYAGSWLPEPIVEQDGPQDEALLADAVGMALLVVLDALDPAERLAFVLHDMFGVPFSDIAEIVGRSPDAARQLASRARRRVRGRVPEPDPDLELQRKVVDAFLAASREGDFAGLVAVLDPDVVFRIDTGGTPAARDPVSGAEAVARQILARGTPLAPLARPAIVNGGAGAVVAVRDRPFAVVGFTIVGGRILAIDLVIDPAKLGSVS
jgi:RNA polymerase sigma-70 factor (ECF subfamily)